MCLLYAIPYIPYIPGSPDLEHVIKPTPNTVFLTYLHTTYVSFIPYLLGSPDHETVMAKVGEMAAALKKQKIRVKVYYILIYMTCSTIY
jgi:hypothetical protein